MSRTPWSSQASAQTTRSKGKGKKNESPKSKEVLDLEGLVESLKLRSHMKDPEGGCFCQARKHVLSKYTPICMQCGLVLCYLNRPNFSCAHCASPLLDATSRDTLVQRLLTEISKVVAREHEERERKERERQNAINAFPSLPGASSAAATGTGPKSVGTTQPRKVLSLNSKTRKVTVASYTQAIPAQTRELKAAEERVPPPKDVDFLKGRERGTWENSRRGRIIYVPTSSSSNTAGNSQERRRKKRTMQATS